MAGQPAKRQWRVVRRQQPSGSKLRRTGLKGGKEVWRRRDNRRSQGRRRPRDFGDDKKLPPWKGKRLGRR
ncbi:hypothetical protein LINPERPRIM_LOCUS14716 [Linum perenne]